MKKNYEIGIDDFNSYILNAFDEADDYEYHTVLDAYKNWHQVFSNRWNEKIVCDNL